MTQSDLRIIYPLQGLEITGSLLLPLKVYDRALTLRTDGQALVDGLSNGQKQNLGN